MREILKVREIFKVGEILKVARDLKVWEILGSPEGCFGAIHDSSLGSLESRGYCRE